MKTSGFLLLVLLSTSSFAFKTEGPGRLLQPHFSSAPACEERPEFLTEMRNDFVSSLSRLPETVLVARNAEYYVEGMSAGEPVKLYGYQSFLQSSPSRVLCGQGSENFKERFALMAPTLIDTHKIPKVGQSLWQFQFVAEGTKYSFWNVKSPVTQNPENLEKWIRATGANYKVYQRSHDEFEILLVKKDRDVTQYLSIRYDSVPQWRSN